VFFLYIPGDVVSIDVGAPVGEDVSANIK